MHLINEEDGINALQLLDDPLHPLLKLAPVNGARHQRAHVQLQELFVKERVWCLASHDPLRQSLHDGCLPHAWLTDEGRIVLGTSSQNLDDSLDLLVAANDGIQLPCFSHCCEINSQLIQQRRG